MNPKILAVFAHPDDEAFSTGGTISCYAEAGIDITLVCATRGEAGEISDPGFATSETLGQVREQELRCAAETMGIKELYFLDYRDSGMAGTTENKDPRAFMNAPAEAVISALVEIIRRVQPQIIVTFEPNGGYGHPDHIAIHNHTVSAFHAAADPSYHPEIGPAWSTKRLFYTAIPRSFFLELRRHLTLLGEDTSDFDQMLAEQEGWPDEAVNVTMDVSATVEDKWDALYCHRTQFGPGNFFRRLPEKDAKLLMSKEYFTLAWPEPAPGVELPDLFSEIQDN